MVFQIALKVNAIHSVSASSQQNPSCIKLVQRWSTNVTLLHSTLLERVAHLIKIFVLLENCTCIYIRQLRNMVLKAPTNADDKAESGHLTSLDDFLKYQEALLSSVASGKTHRSSNSLESRLEGLLKHYEERFACFENISLGKSCGASREEQDAFEHLLVSFLQRAEDTNLLDLSSKSISHVLAFVVNILQGAHGFVQLSLSAQSCLIRLAASLACKHAHVVEPDLIDLLIKVMFKVNLSNGYSLSTSEVFSTIARGLESLSTCANRISNEQQATFLLLSLKSLRKLRESQMALDAWHIELVVSHLNTAFNLAHLASLHSCIHQNSGEIVETLKFFWTFGSRAQSSRTDRAASHFSSSPESVTTPKHLPWRQKTKTVANVQLVSESSQSEPDTSMAPHQNTSARVRVAALQVVTQMLRSHPAALHQVWNRLLPHSLPLNAASGPRTLLSVLLHDTSAMVRVVSATALQAMMSGARNRSFMRVANCTSHPKQRHHWRPRAFTPLSESMAAMLITIHQALVQCLCAETHPEVLVESLKVATLLLMHTPYQTMPHNTAVELLHALVECWDSFIVGTVAKHAASIVRGSPRSPRHDNLAARCSILASFTAALQTQPSTSVLQMCLLPIPPDFVAEVPPPPPIKHQKPPSPQPFTVALVMSAMPHCSRPALQWEAITTLRALCTSSTAQANMIPPWPDVKTLAQAHINAVLLPSETRCASRRSSTSGQGSSASMAEKVANQAIRLAADCLQVHLRAQVDANTEALSLTSGPAYFLRNDEHRTDVPYAGGVTPALVVMVSEFMCLILMCIEQSAVSVLRSAAFAAISTVPQLWGLSPPSYELLAICTRAQTAASQDPVPAVRVQAVCALEAMVSSAENIACVGSGMRAVVEALVSSVADSSASVCIAGSSALATLCDTLKSVVHGNVTDVCSSAVLAEGGVHQLPPLAGLSGCCPENCFVSSCAAQLVSMLPTDVWRSLCEAVLSTAKGKEKVRVNGMRAVGCLISVAPAHTVPVSPHGPEYGRYSGDEASGGQSVACEVAQRRANDSGGVDFNWKEWSSAAASVLVSGLKTGNAKCAWNACISISQLFRWWRALGVDLSVMSAAHEEVTEQLRCSNNFKVRIHAALALQAAAQHMPASSFDTAAVICAVRHATQTLCEDKPDVPSGVGVEPLRLDPGLSKLLHHKPRPPVDLPGDAGSMSVNFRYHAELMNKLTAVLADYVALVRPSDAAVLQLHSDWVIGFFEDRVSSWSVSTAPVEGFEAEDIPPQSESLRANGRSESCGNDEVAVQGAQLQLSVPAACMNVAAAVTTLSHLVTDGHIRISDEAMLLLRSLTHIISNKEEALN